MWKDSVYGKKLRKVCIAFFKNSYASSYLECSKIRDIYKNEYRIKILKFLEGSENPDKFDCYMQ